MRPNPDVIFKSFDDLNIPYTRYDHEAVFTVAESQKVDKNIAAHHTRNMFLRTKKKQNFLLTLSHDTPVDLKKLEILLGVKNFSFGSPDRLMEILGVYPGSVTPLSSINAMPKDITILLEQKMMDSQLIAVHPLVNTMTVTLTPSDLLKFMTHYGHSPITIDLSAVAP
jgi:Ala-tRNA(Pro) deacylase